MVSRCIRISVRRFNPSIFSKGSILDYLPKKPIYVDLKLYILVRSVATGLFRCDRELFINGHMGLRT